MEKIRKKEKKIENFHKFSAYLVTVKANIPAHLQRQASIMNSSMWYVYLFCASYKANNKISYPSLKQILHDVAGIR